MVKVASWNVNSLKVRLPQVLEWIESSGVDILALQETKTIDENFPEAAFTDKGLYVAYSGQKTYNGVAIISRWPIENVVTDIPNLVDPQRRILAADLNGIRLIDLYVPNGSEVGSDKFHYKLNWIEKVTDFIQEEMKSHKNIAVVGDFNIAPHDIDVHDPKAWEGSVLVSPPEREAFSKLLDLGLFDTFHELHPNEQVFSWWDYRAAGFRRNRGLRIDHILINDSLKSACKGCEIDAEPRKAERPSDHAPIWASFDIN